MSNLAAWAESTADAWQHHGTPCGSQDIHAEPRTRSLRRVSHSTAFRSGAQPQRTGLAEAPAADEPGPPPTAPSPVPGGLPVWPGLPVVRGILRWRGPPATPGALEGDDRCHPIARIERPRDGPRW